MGIITYFSIYCDCFVTVFGNILPVPFILLFAGQLKIFAKSEKISNLLDWIFERTYKKADEKVRRWGYLALILFVAISPPGTGAWTSSLITYLFKFDIKTNVVNVYRCINCCSNCPLNILWIFQHILNYGNSYI